MNTPQRHGSANKMDGADRTFKCAVPLTAYLPGLEELWADTSGHPTIRIAVLDGPVDRNHPALRGARLEELETLVEVEVGTGPASRHGTQIASILFGQSIGWVRGLAHACTGLIVTVFSDGPEDMLRSCTQLNLARAIIQCVNAGAHIICISAGQLSPEGVALDYLEKAIHLCAEQNILIVAAAGNEGCECLHVPAALPSVLAVGAAAWDGAPLESSNWGKAYQAQGILALGEGIPSAIPGGAISCSSGTSYATAIVAGVAGLLLSVQHQRNEKPNPHQIRSILLETASPCDPATISDCRRHLVGTLDIRSAYSRINKHVGESDIAGSAFADRHSDIASSAFIANCVVPLEDSTEWRSKMANETTLPETETPSVVAAAAPVVSDQQMIPAAADTAANIAGIVPSDCGCGCGGKEAGGNTKPQLVYALGLLGYDFANETRRDALVQEGLREPYSPAALLSHLKNKPLSASAVTWTLNQESTPIYAIYPVGPFAAVGYEILRDYLQDQLAGVELVSVPGFIAGKLSLSHGQVVPAIVPELRGMYSWNVPSLVQAAIGAPPSEPSKEGKDPKYKEELARYKQRATDIGNFLQRVYYELRNLGATPQERALNWAATNAFQAVEVFRDAINRDMKLDSIQVERSPLCRPSSDCWDVKLTFFNPNRRYEQARHVYRLTVDVSDVIPVTVGKVRDWDMY